MVSSGNDIQEVTRQSPVHESMKDWLPDTIRRGQSPIAYENGRVNVDLSDADAIESAILSCLELGDYDTVKDLNEALACHDLVEGRSVFRHYPMTLQLEHTSFCNAECIMCVHYYRRNIGASHLTDDFVSCLESVMPYLRTIVLHGNGEPFMDPALGSRLDLYSRYHIHVSTNTNMSILPDAVLAHHELFETLTVSLDSVDPRMYSIIRKGLNLERVTENIRRFRSASSQTFMTLATVVMRHNIAELERIVEYAVENGFQRVIFTRVGINDNALNKYDDPVLYPSALKTHLKRAIQVAEAVGIELIYPDYFLSLSDSDYDLDIIRIGSEPWDPPRQIDRCSPMSERWSLYGFDLNPQKSRSTCNGICDRIWDTAMVTAKGEVIACCIDVLHNVGNLDRDFTEVWNGNPLVRLRELFFSGKLPRICDNCMFITNNGLELLKVDRADDFYENQKFKNG